MLKIDAENDSVFALYVRGSPFFNLELGVFFGGSVVFGEACRIRSVVFGKAKKDMLIYFKNAYILS